MGHIKLLLNGSVIIIKRVDVKTNIWLVDWGFRAAFKTISAHIAAVS